LNGLHQKFQKTVVDDELVNTELRTLNYEHILNILLRRKWIQPWWYSGWFAGISFAL
jgi:hypothetical protein